MYPEYERKTSKALSLTVVLYECANKVDVHTTGNALHESDWERFVLSMKVAIGGVTNPPRKPNYQTLEVLLVEAKFVINSRALTYMLLKSEDHESFTPNLFLLGNYWDLT